MKFKAEIIQSTPPMLETCRSWDECGGIINLFHQGDDLMISVGEGSEAINYTLVGNLSLSSSEFFARGWLTPDETQLPLQNLGAGVEHKSDSPFFRPTAKVDLRLVPHESPHDIKFKIEVLESEPPMIESARSWKECDGVVELFHENNELIISAGQLRYIFRGVDLTIESDKISTKGWITPDPRNWDEMPLYETIQPNSTSRVNFSLTPI